MVDIPEGDDCVYAVLQKAGTISVFQNKSRRQMAHP
jgi:DNA polymerase III alpha subunit